MQRLVGLFVGLCVVLGGFGVAAAQEDTMPPPKVLLVGREWVKPGKTGAVHEKSESAFVQAFAKAKWPTHYLAVSSLSGRSRVLFLAGYDSFDAWEKDYAAVMKNTALSSALDRALVADGELLSDFDQSILVYDEDESLRPNVDIAHMRYFEISLYHVKPGHHHDWEEIVKLVKAAYEKIPDVHWATYETAYSQQPSGTYVIFSAHKSAAEIDHLYSENKDFVTAMGEEGMKKLRELESAAIDSDQSNLFAFTPSMSYAPDEWVKADPEFWKPKMMSSGGMKKPAEKPAEKPAQ